MGGENEPQTRLRQGYGAPSPPAPRLPPSLKLWRDKTARQARVRRGFRRRQGSGGQVGGQVDAD